jgi:hypothetical protein
MVSGQLPPRCSQCSKSWIMPEPSFTFPRLTDDRIKVFHSRGVASAFSRQSLQIAPKSNGAREPCGAGE